MSGARAATAGEHSDFMHGIKGADSGITNLTAAQQKVGGTALLLLCQHHKTASQSPPNTFTPSGGLNLWPR